MSMLVQYLREIFRKYFIVIVHYFLISPEIRVIK